MFWSPIQSFRGKPITRSVVEIPKGLRYAGSRVVGLKITGDPGFLVLSPCTGWMRRKNADGFATFEFEALPFEFRAITAALGTWPTLYIAVESGFTSADVAENGRVGWNTELARDVTELRFAICAGDRVSDDILRLLSWMDDAVGDPRATSRPFSLITSAATDAIENNPLILRDAAGHPLAGRAVTVVGGATSTSQSTDAGGDLIAGATMSRAELETRRIFSSDSLFASDDGTTDIGGIDIGPGMQSIAFTHLPDWFAENESDALARWTTQNRVTTFLNAEVFDDIFTELSQIGTAPNPGFHLTGYFISLDDILADLEGIPGTTQEAVEALVAVGGAARFLALDFFQLESDAVDDVGKALMVVLVAALAGAVVIDLLVDEELLDATAIMHLVIVTIGGMIGAGHLEEVVEALGEPNKTAVDGLTAPPGSIALFDPYPATTQDNPLRPTSLPSESILNAVLELMNHFNVFHQKIAIIKNDNGIHAYAGGVDLNPDRLDDFEHKISAPFKDLHARVDGPAVRDLAITFAERWANRSSEPLAIATPEYADLPTPGNDAVQIARTYFRPHEDRAASGLPFAMEGEKTILETTLKAIRNAKEFIYIEDQYLTPPSEYIAAMRAAIDRGVEVFIMIPATPDQPFGFGPRSAFIDSIPEAHVGVMRRGYNALRTIRKSDNGRFYLAEKIEEPASTNETVKAKPAANVPTPPFWMVVDEEIIMVANKVPTTEDEVVQLQIRRGEETHFFGRDKGSSPKEHKSGAAATAVDFAGVYVNSKTMIVDDVFASIGSANVNRRGFFSDGECNIFAIPGRLRFSDENWIRDLRKRLWSEALNIPERVGDVVFHDPLGGVPYFKRSRKQGNRFVAFETEQIYPEIFGAAGTSGPLLGIEGLGLLAVGAQLAAALIIAAEEDAVFDIVSDPTSWVDESWEVEP